MSLTSDEESDSERSDATGTELPPLERSDATGTELPPPEEVLDSEGRRIEKFCPKCYLFRTPKENYCIVCGTKLKEIKLKPRKK